MNGQNVSEFNWARIDQVNTLFNKFLSDAGVQESDLLARPEDEYKEENPSDWATGFFHAGFTTTFTLDDSAIVQVVAGVTQNLVAPPEDALEGSFAVLLSFVCIPMMGRGFDLAYSDNADYQSE